MAEIIQGDSGTIIQVTVSDNNGVVDLRAASDIEVTIKTPKRRIVKQGVVVDGILGLVEFILNQTDTEDIGVCVFQIRVNFTDGSSFGSDLKRFTIGQRL